MKAIALSILLGLTSVVWAQSDYLIADHIGKDRVKYYHSDKRIKVKLSNGDVIKGRFGIQDDKLYISGQHVPLDDIQTLRTKSLASYITGGVLGTTSAIITGAGIALVIQGLRDPDECAGTLAIIVGVPIAAAGLVVFGIPATLFLTIGKKHRSHKWNFSTGSKPEDQERRKKRDSAELFYSP